MRRRRKKTPTKMMNKAYFKAIKAPDLQKQIRGFFHTLLGWCCLHKIFLCKKYMINVYYCAAVSR